MVALQSASKLFSREKTWKVRQRQAQASNTDHRPIVAIVIVLTTSILYIVLSTFARLWSCLLFLDPVSFVRQTEPRSFTWTIGGCYVLVRFAQWNWRDETMKRWNKANMEQSWAIISLSHFHRCSFRCTSCYCLLLLKIPEMCSLAIFEIPWGQKWIPCNGNLATELWMKIPWCAMSFVEPCGQILVDRNCLAFDMTIYIDIMI